MLRGIRNASANWLGRTVMTVVMGLLAASFAIWGINDIFRGFGRSTLAKVGGTEISIEVFRQAYNDRLQQLSRQAGRPITAEQAKAIGLDRRVLSEMVAEAALDQRARQMRLAIPDDEIVKRITADKTFQGPTGKFDRSHFELLLRSAGYTEQRFVAEQRQMMLRRAIGDSLSAAIPVPTAWLDAITTFQNQERAIAYVTLGAAQAGDIPQPSEEELKKYFEAHKFLFRAPEYRKIVTLQLTPEALAKWMEISEADVKAVYDAHPDKYGTPERRHVEEIVFPSAADAEAAETSLKSGLSFAALAAERGLTQQDIDLGTVTKSALVDPAVADAAFALKEGEVSAPVKGRFGTVIVTVAKIEPGETKTLAEAAPQIRNEIALDRAKAQVRDLHDKIEDERGGGASLEQAAAKFKLPLTTLAAVDRTGRDDSGKVIADFPHAGDVISAAFASDVGVDNDPVAADGGYIWYDVASVSPAHERSFDEVKNQVEQGWRRDEIATRLQTKAAELVDKLRAGTALDALAKADGLDVAAADKLKRGQPGALSPRAVEAVFRTAKDGFGSASNKPDEWIVFRVTDLTTPAFNANSPEAKQLDEVVGRQIADDVFGEYVAALEDELGTNVNQAALAQAVSGGAPTDTE
jgi:peptidyl-prolyl cis-trans isomerase D